MFRVIHADGVVGGLTPRLDILLNFWSERFPIPQEVVYLVEKDGKLGDEVKEERKIRPAIVREVESGVIVDLETAKEIRDWLSERIAEANQILQKAKKEEPQP